MLSHDKSCAKVFKEYEPHENMSSASNLSDMIISDDERHENESTVSEGNEQSSSDEKDSLVCKFCKGSFSCEKNLKRHQKTAKRCLSIQNKPIVNPHTCSCGYSTGIKGDYVRHSRICSGRSSKPSNQKIEELEAKLRTVKEQLDRSQTILETNNNTEPSSNACRLIIGTIYYYKLPECQDIARSYGIDPDGTETILQYRIRDHMSKILLERGEPIPRFNTHREYDTDDEKEHNSANNQIPENMSITSKNRIGWSSEIQQLAARDDMLSIKEFINERRLSVEDFQIEEYWDGWNAPEKYIVVNKHMLDWMGYKGPLKKQREHFLELANSILKADDEIKTFLPTSPSGRTDVIGAIDQGRFTRIIAITYFGLKKLSMSLRTERGEAIRESYIKQEMLFKLYMQYQNEFHTNKNLRHIEEQTIAIDKLKRSVARHEKKHRYIAFGIDAPTYYIFSYGRRCVEHCPTRNMRKHGIAIKNKTDSSPLDIRLNGHRTTFKLLIVEFLVSGPPNSIELLEKCMENRFGERLNPNSSEIFDGVSLDALRYAAIYFLDGLCRGEYNIVPQNQIDAYNRDVDSTMKDFSSTDHNTEDKH